MPLSAAKPQLQQSLYNVFSKPNHEIDAATKIASAYTAYASNARSCAAGVPDSTSLSAANQVLKGQLNTIFLTSKDLVSTFNRMALAFTAFWVSPPILFISLVTTPGVITVPPIPAGLVASLMAAFMPGIPSVLNGRRPMDDNQVAQAWANSLHAFTSLIVVTHAGPPGIACVSPIT